MLWFSHSDSANLEPRIVLIRRRRHHRSSLHGELVDGTPEPPRRTVRVRQYTHARCESQTFRIFQIDEGLQHRKATETKTPWLRNLQGLRSWPGSVSPSSSAGIGRTPEKRSHSRPCSYSWPTPVAASSAAVRSGVLTVRVKVGGGRDTRSWDVLGTKTPMSIVYLGSA